jgi:hypothetical protein
LDTQSIIAESSYTYTLAGRLPANVQNLTNAARVLEGVVGRNAKGKLNAMAADPTATDRSCLAQFSVGAPGTIDVTRLTGELAMQRLHPISIIGSAYCVGMLNARHLVIIANLDKALLLHFLP